MKVTDLMIGDWVICYHPTCKPKQIQVNAGLLNGLERQDLGFQTEESPLFRIVEPIPLTAEILAKNGWIVREANKMGVVIFTQHFEFCDKLLGIKDSIVSRIDCDPYGDFHYMCNGKSFCYINSVHELQHVLPLLGIDKKIKL